MIGNRVRIEETCERPANNVVVVVVVEGFGKKRQYPTQRMMEEPCFASIW